MGFTGKDVHIDVPLSNVAIAYRPQNLIAEEICPIVTVPKQSDAYYVWSLADALRIEEDKRAPGAEANVITRSVSSGTFFAYNYALKDRIPYEDIENADAGFVFTERSSRVEMLKDKLYLGWEYRVALQCTSTSNVGSSTATASAWTDYTNSNPIGNIRTAIYNVEGATGYRPNSIIFGRYAWFHFLQNDDVQANLFGTVTGQGSPKIVTRQSVATMLELDRVLVGGGIYNTAQEGQSASLSNLWNDQVLVYFAPLQPRKDVPSFMYAFRWGKVMNMEARVYDLPRNHAEEIELGYYQDEKITASALGFLLTGVGSSQ